MAVFFKTLILPPWHLSLIVSPKTAILGSQKVDLPPFRNHIWRIGQLASSSLRGGVGLLISGLQHAKFTLWASFNLPSSQARVTSVNSLSKLEKYYFTVTSVLMHALILVIWGDTTTANWREPYQCYQCDFNFFCLNMHSQMFFRRSFNSTNGTRRHGDFKFVLPLKFWISDMTIFSLPKTKKYWESESNQCKRCWPISQVDGCALWFVGHAGPPSTAQIRRANWDIR